MYVYLYEPAGAANGGIADSCGVGSVFMLGVVAPCVTSIVMRNERIENPPVKWQEKKGTYEY
jgi:hypothetical protein